MAIALHFLSAAQPELAEIVFTPVPGDERVARRGKGLVFTDDQASFQWTKAVKAFALLFVGTKLAQLSDTPFELTGQHGSAAASLDYAISKPTEWVAGLFGGKRDQQDFRRKAFKISNSEQKLPGPVTVHLSASFGEPEALQIFLDDQKLSSSTDLLRLYLALGGEPFPTATSTVAPHAEPLLSMRTVSKMTAPSESAPWYAGKEFFTLVHAEISKALRETEVLESLGISQAEERLALLRPLPTCQLLKPVYQQLRSRIPPDHLRYSDPAESPRLINQDRPLRIGCPPMAMSSLLVLRTLAADSQIPIEIYSHHPSSSAILSTIENTELDFVILSWGATEKLFRSPEKSASQAVMLLPRTSIDLVAPRFAEGLPTAPLSVFLSTEETGYPFQYYSAARSIEGSRWNSTTPIDANIVEIVAQLTKGPNCGVIAFPFSALLTLHFNYQIEALPQLAGTRLGDNILFGVSERGRDSVLVRDLRAAIQSNWYRLLEDPRFLERSIESLLSDSQYIQSLKRLGGLYRIRET